MDKNTDSKDGAADGQKVVLVSMEGDRFEVPLKVAQMSDLVKTMVDPDELGASPWLLACCWGARARWAGVRVRVAAAGLEGHSSLPHVVCRWRGVRYPLASRARLPRCVSSAILWL